jgi:RND family efflux transporter MFP subunit
MVEHAPPDPVLNRKIRRYALILLVVAVALGAWGIVSRVLARAAIGRENEAALVTTVVTVSPAKSGAGEDLALSGSVQAYHEAPIFARTSGYLKAWYTDIGTPVTKGQQLAEIESPEIDQQYNQAQADLATAVANEQLAETTNQRWQALLATESVSKQDADQKAGDAAAKKAARLSAAANLARQRDLESFKRVVAPFDGIVTARNTDVGALINAGQTTGTELFHVADTHKLRIFVQVPEAFSAFAKPGLAAQLRFMSQPRKSYTATVVHTANALDPVARTLQVELQLDNLQHEVFPGSYADVHFQMPTDAQILRLPANTLLFRAAGLQVATVTADQKIKLKSIVQGRDFGSTVEVVSGIEPDDVVVVNPPDSIIDGAPVRIAPKST